MIRFARITIIAILATLAVLPVAAQEITLPLIGKVAAGSPLLAQENVLANPAIDPETFRPRADYLLSVRGMSMRDAGILDGDWLAVHKQPQAQSGQIVVARLGARVVQQVPAGGFGLSAQRVVRRPGRGGHHYMLNVPGWPAPRRRARDISHNRRRSQRCCGRGVHVQSAAAAAG